MKKLPSNLGCEFNEDAKCQKWELFLAESIARKSQIEQVREFLRESILRDNFGQEKLMLIVGFGATGKSVFKKVIESVLGEDNFSDEEILGLANISQSARIVSKINGKLVNFCTEINGKIMLSCVGKELVSREPMVARELYKSPYIAKDLPRIICMSDFFPDMPDGGYRRIIPIEFTNLVPKEKQNPNLAEELKEELSGILNWILND